MNKDNRLKDAYLETRKKQKARMIKCTCPKCGYILRTSKKNIDLAIPICPVTLCSHFQVIMEVQT